MRTTAFKGQAKETEPAREHHGQRSRRKATEATESRVTEAKGKSASGWTERAILLNDNSGSNLSKLTLGMENQAFLSPC